MATLFYFRRKRYTAYRQLVRLCWGYLDRDVRVPLPAWAVHKTRQIFPSLNYHGFQGPHWNYLEKTTLVLCNILPFVRPVEICSKDRRVEDWFNTYLGYLQYVSWCTNVWFMFMKGLLVFRNCFLDFAVEHCFGCRATEPGFVGDIDAIEVWLIDWLIDSCLYMLSSQNRLYDVLG